MLVMPFKLNKKIDKMNQYRLMFLTIMLLLSFGAVTAQNETRKEQEFSVYGKGFFSFLRYNLPEGANLNKGNGAGLGVQYSLSLKRRWSVSAGVEYQQYRSEVLLHGFSDSYQTTDAEGTDFDFYSYANTYKEKQWVDMVNIPILFRYETPTPWTNAFIYGAVGFQLGIPVSSKYKAIAEDLKTSGYFQQWDAMLDNPGFMGFGNWGTVGNDKQELDVRNSYSLLFEVGFKQQLNEKRNLYLGFYADLGLNSLAKESSSSSALTAYDADNPTDFKFNPLFYSAPHAQGEAYVTKPKIQGFGIKIQYAFKL